MFIYNDIAYLSVKSAGIALSEQLEAIDTPSYWGYLEHIVKNNDIYIYVEDTCERQSKTGSTEVKMTKGLFKLKPTKNNNINIVDQDECIITPLGTQIDKCDYSYMKIKAFDFTSYLLSIGKPVTNWHLYSLMRNDSDIHRWHKAQCKELLYKCLSEYYEAFINVPKLRIDAAKRILLEHLLYKSKKERQRNRPVSPSTKAIKHYINLYPNGSVNTQRIGKDGSITPTLFQWAYDNQDIIIDDWEITEIIRNESISFINSKSGNGKAIKITSLNSIFSALRRSRKASTSLIFHAV